MTAGKIFIITGRTVADICLTFWVFIASLPVMLLPLATQDGTGVWT